MQFLFRNSFCSLGAIIFGAFTIWLSIKDISKAFSNLFIKILSISFKQQAFIWNILSFLKTKFFQLA
jgi:hypothetical protein